MVTHQYYNISDKTQKWNPCVTHTTGRVIKIFIFLSEVYFKDLSSSKSLPIREVKAEHIGKLVTIRGKIIYYSVATLIDEEWCMILVRYAACLSINYIVFTPPY